MPKNVFPSPIAVLHLLKLAAADIPLWQADHPLVLRPPPPSPPPTDAHHNSNSDDSGLRIYLFSILKSSHYPHMTHFTRSLAAQDGDGWTVFRLR